METDHSQSIIKNAEQKNYGLYEDEISRRLAQTAWKSFESRGAASNSMINKFLSIKNLSRGNLEDINDTSETAKTAEYEQRLIESMRRLIGQNLIESGRELKQLDSQETNYDLLLKMAKAESGNQTSSRSELTDYIRDELERINENRNALTNRNPESYTLVHGLEFREHIRQVHSGELVGTPYVKGHLSRVERNISEGRPTFLHGHLGSGKTELAINAAKNASIDKAAYEEAMKDAKAYMATNPDATEADNLAFLGRAYREHQNRFKKASREDGRFSPLIISGSKDLTSQDLFVDKTLKLTKFNGKSLLEHKDDLDAEIAKWASEHPDEAEDPEKSKEEANKILELFKLKNQAFGTEVDIIKKAIYRGVEEGKPVIIDEINAIPSAVLISLNDILQRRPGQECYIPGVGTRTIQPGFAIIMTGNLSTDSINYSGTEDLNPAFLSRLDIIEHDYLPMSESDRSYEEQVDPESNELFHVAISYLADRQGNLRLPEMEKSLDKLFSLCQLAHETQLVFAGKWRQSISSSSGDEIEPSLEKSVLSIRNLLNVLKEWDKGSEKDLDKALWDGFITSITESDDQNFVLELAKRYGFFSEHDGWNIQIKGRGSGFTSLREAHPDRFNFKRAPLETYSVRKMVEVLYGPGPERELYPEDIDFDEIENLTNDEVSLDDFETFETKLSELDKTIQALSILGEQCGCSKEAPSED